MIKSSVKFTHNTFEYYELTISPQTKLDEIKAKLSGFSQLTHENNSNIVIGLTEDYTEISQLEAFVSSILDCATLYKLNINLINANKNLISSQIAGLSVVNLPTTKKSKPLDNKTLYIDTPIRSGVSVFNDGDIVITNFVSNGAEIVAGGNIHIYGELRGRVIAGSGGNKLAKIFVTKFNPELIAIGGIYRAIDTKLPDNILNKFVVVSLDNKDKLNLSALKIGD